MTQAAIRNTTRAADAILALINSRPRTPTRGEIMGALANFRSEASNNNGPWQPSPEAQEALTKLPAWAAAIRVESHYPATGAPDFNQHEWRQIIDTTAECGDQVEDYALELFKRPFYPPVPDWSPNTPQHLVDLALMANIHNEGDLVLECGRWEMDGEALSVGQTAEKLLVHIILGMAGIKAKDVTLNAAYNRHEEALAAKLIETVDAAQAIFDRERKAG